MSDILQGQDELAMGSPPALKPPVDPVLLEHIELRQDDFWRCIPAYKDLSAAAFHDHRFQVRNCITSLQKFRAAIGNRVSEAFCQDLALGLKRSTMSMRISPYIFSLIDWDDPLGDPLRKQFMPLESTLMPDPPELALDSLHEQAGKRSTPASVPANSCDNASLKSE